jgi:hypothetical protein
MESEVHYLDQKSPLLGPFLSQINPVDTPSSYLRSILILFIHLCLDLPSSFYPSGFPTKLLHAFLFCHSCYIPCPSHPPWLDHSKYTWWRVQVMLSGFLAPQYGTSSCWGFRRPHTNTGIKTIKNNKKTCWDKDIHTEVMWNNFVSRLCPYKMKCRELCFVVTISVFHYAQCNLLSMVSDSVFKLGITCTQPESNLCLEFTVLPLSTTTNLATSLEFPGWFGA